MALNVKRDEKGRFIKGNIPWHKGKKGLLIPWNKGKTGIYSEETLEKMRIAGKNRPPNRLETHHTKESIEKMRIAHLKNPTRYWLGKKRSEETNGKNRLAHLGKHANEETLKKMSKAQSGENNANYGKHFSKEYRKKLSRAHIGIQAREKNPNWRGGISFEPYTPEFNRQLKELIRQRDGYKCQLCGMPEIENIERLSIHHIDYIKKNCLPDNLIALCRSCNGKVNSNRDYWTEYFKEKILEKVT